MIKLSVRLLFISLVVACMFLPPGAMATADEATGEVTVLEPDYITLTPPSPTITLGNTSTLQFTAIASYTGGTNVIVTDIANWTSSNTGVATVGFNTGLATILAAGSTIITATYGGKTDSTVLSVQSAGGGGGGGGSGGGGGGGVTGEKRITPLMSITDQSFRLLEDIEALSVDIQAILIIKKDTIVKNKVDEILSAISVETLVTPPDITQFIEIIGSAYNIGPEGAKFEPPALLILKYSEEALPAGILEKNLYIATWNEADKVWGKIASSVHPDSNFIIANLDHLSIYAIMAGTRPADLILCDLTVNPVEVGINDDVTVGVLAANAGDLTGSFEVVFKVDNTAIKTQTVTLKGRESQTISFSVNPSPTGQHTVSVNELSKTFEVNESHTAQLPATIPTPQPSPVPTLTPVPIPVPASTSTPTMITTPTPVRALPVQPTENQIPIYLISIIGGIVVITVLVYLFIRRRRS